MGVSREAENLKCPSSSSPPVNLEPSPPNPLYSLRSNISLEATYATSITLESVLSVIRRGALQAPVQACWETFGTRRSSDTSKDAIFTDSDFSQNLIAGAPVHHISETIKNTSLFHPPGLQMQFYLVLRGAPPEPPTLPAGPLKS